jgi:hypothetical protein
MWHLTHAIRRGAPNQVTFFSRLLRLCDEYGIAPGIRCNKQVQRILSVFYFVRIMAVHVLTKDDPGGGFNYPFHSIMIQIFPARWCWQLAIVTTLVLPELASAQFFTAGNGDLVAGFRKTGAYQGSYELVVKIGSVTNLLALPAGSSIPINSFSPSQLSGAFSDYNNLQWSVSGMVSGGPGFYWSGFYQSTIWYTLPRNNINSQTAPLARQSVTTQGTTEQKIIGFLNGANLLSSGMGSTNSNNTAVLVRETIASANNNDYAFFVQDPQNPALGDFKGTMPTTVENTTPASFTSAVVSDLYQSVPQLSNDPNTGTNNGAAYYVGYFTLNPNGTMTFTRASTVVAQPPAPKIVSVSRSGTTSTIFFTTTNGTFTYSLYYTNSTGLAAPVTNWPASPTTLTGNGLTNSLTDTTTDTNRFYRIGVQ